MQGNAFGACLVQSVVMFMDMEMARTHTCCILYITEHIDCTSGKPVKNVRSAGSSFHPGVPLRYRICQVI